jgi:hypothetical protein
MIEHSQRVGPPPDSVNQKLWPGISPSHPAREGFLRSPVSAFSAARLISDE